MPGWNSFTLVGHVGQDPEKRGQESVVASFSVAENQFKQGVDRVVWWRVAAFGATGERALETVRKGQLVLVQGRISSEPQEADGRTYYRHDLIANTIRVLDRKEKEQQEEAPW